MIDASLQPLLTEDTRFTSLASDRLYPNVLPDSLISSNGTPASATSQIVSTIPDYTNDGATGLQKTRIRYTGIGTEYSDASSTAEAIRAVLESYHGTLADGTIVSNVLVVNQSSTYSDEARLYFVAYDFVVYYAD